MTIKEDLEAQIAELTRQNQELRLELDSLRVQVDINQDTGYLISTPNKGYNGNTAGVAFKNGQAFLPASDQRSARMAQMFEADFHYQVEFIGGKNG